MVPFQTLSCLLCIGLCPGEPAQQQVEPPTGQPAKPVIGPQLQALLDVSKELDRLAAAGEAELERLEREAKALSDAYEKREARWACEAAAAAIVRFNSSFNTTVRERTGFRLPSIKYWQLVSPRNDDPNLPQAIKDDDFLNDYAQFKFVLSDIKFEFNVVCWTWTGKWLPNPEFLNTTLHRLPGSE